MPSQNDLNLDVYTHDIIHADIVQLKDTPCKNAYLDDEIRHGLALDHMMSLAELPGDETDEEESEGSHSNGFVEESRIEEEASLFSR